MSHAAPERRETVLRVRDLVVRFRLRGGRRRSMTAVRGIDLDLRHGETLAIVGESGSGKSTTARAIMRLIPGEGSVELCGTELMGLKGRRLAAARSDIQMVFQDPYSSLDPALPVCTSIEEPLEVHTDLTGPQRRERVLELLRLVGLREEMADRYPHDFSGGQRQRIAIARAIAASPSIVVADEAVSALDVSSQNQVLQLLEELSRSLGIAFLFISHDLAVVRNIADRVAVMYLGTIVEEANVEELFADPQHPYTQALLASALLADPVRQAERRGRGRLDGDPPDPADPPSGCVFRTRCPQAMAICAERPPTPTPRAGDGAVACHLYTDEGHPDSRRSPDAEPLTQGRYS